MDRRSFIKNIGLGTLAVTATTASTMKAIADDTPSPYEIVVVGGGFGGASAAKYAALWGGSAVNVTLIDSNPSHVSCILSNLILNGQKTLSNLTFNLTQSATKNHFTFKQGKLVSTWDTLQTKALDKDDIGRYILMTKPDQTIEKVYFDRLILAPGIDFDYQVINGMDNKDWIDSNTPFPHAWKAGPQTNNLRDQLKMLPSNGKAQVVMTIPAAPYRCPPGPYERACLIADYLKTKKGGGKLYVLDANPKIQAEPINFGAAFNGMYKDIIEYQPNAIVRGVATTSKNFTYVAGTTLLQDKTIDVNYLTKITVNKVEVSVPAPLNPISISQKFHLINVIPNQRAADFLFKDEFAYLLNGSKWAGVHLDTYQSLYDDDIYVIGDAHLSIQPKAGHIANSEAKVCADALLRTLSLKSYSPRIMPDEAPVTNSACFSPITAATASFLTTGFRYDITKDNVVKIDEASGEAEQISSDNYKMMLAWANNLFAEVF